MLHMAQQYTVVWRVEDTPKAFKLSKISVDSAHHALSKVPCCQAFSAYQGVYVLAYSCAVVNKQ